VGLANCRAANAIKICISIGQLTKRPIKWRHWSVKMFRIPTAAQLKHKATQFAGHFSKIFQLN